MFNRGSVQKRGGEGGGDGALSAHAKSLKNTLDLVLGQWFLCCIYSTSHLHFTIIVNKDISLMKYQYQLDQENFNPDVTLH